MFLEDQYIHVVMDSLARLLHRNGWDKCPSMTRDGKLTAHATPWAKQFPDDIEALKELDEGDDITKGLPLACRFVYSL